MAKISSARPSSKQSQDGAATASATRTTRATRSQSREPVDFAAAPTPKKRGRKAKSTAELTTVDENVANEDDLRAQLEAEILATDAAAVEDVDAARRVSANSGMSGTTVKTSFSQEEIGELDPEVMVDVLPSLAAAAEDLAKLLVPVDPKSRPVMRKEIRTPGSKYNKLYLNRVASRNVHKHSFGSTEYIQPSIVLRALLGVQNMRDVPADIWRPDPVIYKINLTQMLNCVLIMVDDNVQITEEGKSAIDNLDVHFAAAIAGAEFKQNAFHLCLSLLTQLSIIHVAEAMSHPEFVPEKVVMDTFYAPDQDGDLSFRHRSVLRMLDLAAEEQSAHSNTINQLVHELVDTFKNIPDTMAALGSLRAKYPWETFVETATQYYLERKKELDGQIDTVGGIDQIMRGLNDEVEKRHDARVAEVKRQSFARPGGTPQKAFGKAAIRTLKAREKQIASDGAAPPSSAPTATAPVAQMTGIAVNPSTHATVPVYAAAQSEPILVAEDDGYNRLEDDDYPPQPTQAQSTARSTLAAMSQVQATQRQNAAKGKARSFNDRQEGATRVSFDDSQPLTNYQVPDGFQYPASTQTSRGPGPYFQSPRRGAKRAYEVEEDELEDFEPTQDQGFQVDTRDITAAADQRRREAPQARSSQARFSSTANTAAPSSSATQPHIPSSNPFSSPSKRQRKNPGSAIPTPLAPFDPDDDDEIPRDERMKRAKVAARHGTITARQNKPTQVRTPWNDDEEIALMNLIEEEGAEGIHYSRLKAFDDARPEPLLGRRSAEDMRFKARNMKETFLKGRSVLPRNFEFIVLDKKAINKLHGLGINYQQDRIRGGYVEDVEIEAR